MNIRNVPTLHLVSSVGFTSKIGDSSNEKNNKNRIVIDISNRQYSDILKLIAHEILYHQFYHESVIKRNPTENQLNTKVDLLLRKFGIRHCIVPIKNPKKSPTTD